MIRYFFILVIQASEFLPIIVYDVGEEDIPNLPELF